MGSGRLKKASYSTVTSVMQQFTTIACGLVLPKLILNTYGSAYNGVVASITQYLTIISLLQAGIQGSTRVALYKTLSRKDDAATSAIMVANTRYYRKVAMCLVGYIAILVVAFPLMIHDDISKLDIMLLVLILGTSNFVQYFFGNAYKALLSADQASYILNILQTATVIGNTFICVLVIKANGTLIMAKFASAFVYSLNPMILFWYVKRHYKLDLKAEGDKTALKGRWDVLANSIANSVHNNVDVFFITIFCSALEVSVYSVYNLVAAGLNRMMTVFTSGMEAAFGNMCALGEEKTLKKNFLRYEYIMHAVSIELTGCMLVLILPFISLYTLNVSDVNYIRPTFALLLSLALFTMCIRTPYVTIVQAAGHYKQTKMGSFFEAGLNLVLTIILVMRFGIVGATIGTVVANTFRTIQYGFYVAKHLVKRGYIDFWKRVLWSSATLCCCVFVSNIIINLINAEGWLGWIVKAVVCAGVHLVVLLVSSLAFYRKDLASCVIRIFSLIAKKR